ncbi:MAG: hypothetical protein HQ475_12780 [SAR202 cluster bacterium]|nr:hypothetical protein [SAR202 cluster bacterium]
MKQTKIAKAKTLFRRTRQQAPGFFSRLLADIQDKEYAVFLEPVLRPFQGNSDSHKPGIDEAAAALRALDAIPPVSSSAPVLDVAASVPTEYSGRSEEEVVDPKLVEEIFARPASPEGIPADEPMDEHELGDWDANEVVAATASSPAPTSSIDTEEPAAAISGPSTSSQPRPATAPRVRTMVEAFSEGPVGNDGSTGAMGDFLSEDLKDIFNTVDHTNPRTKALLKSREYVDVHELAEELMEFARSVGAITEKR